MEGIIDIIRELRSEGKSDEKIRDIINFIATVKYNGYIPKEKLDKCFEEA